MVGGGRCLFVGANGGRVRAKEDRSSTPAFLEHMVEQIRFRFNVFRKDRGREVFAYRVHSVERTQGDTIHHQASGLGNNDVRGHGRLCRKTSACEVGTAVESDCAVPPESCTQSEKGHSD